MNYDDFEKEREIKLINDIKRFLDSNLSEMEYFQVDGKNLVTLKEYLINCREQIEKYEQLISKPLKTIQSIDDSIVNIIPLNKKRLHIMDNKNRFPLPIKNNSKESKFEIIDTPEIDIYSPIKRIRFKKALTKANKEYYNELKEIWKIAKDFKIEYDASSVSHLLAYDSRYYFAPYNPNEPDGYIGVRIILPNIFDVFVKDKNVELKDRVDYFINKELIKEIDKEKLLTKVYIPNNIKK